ncbi:MAG TPA: hypothetical protein VGR51_00515, partial [Thermoplasmata archaeon]|nr:hypothetical protein [Thermoplasmata archaeon]
MKRFALAFVALAGCSSGPESFGGPPLRITWGTAGKQRDILTVFGPDVRIPILYLEAYCRSGSTDRKWQDTCIPHKTAKLEESADGRFIKLRCEVQGGVEVTHEIRSGAGEVDFRVEAINRGAEYVDAVWVQPCVRVGEFAGADQ